MSDKTDGQPSIETLASEGISIRKCIASGTDYGSAKAATSPGSTKGERGTAKPQGSLGGLRMKGKGY